MDNNQPKTKKLSSTFVIFIACVLGLGIGLLTINYWHTSSCSSHTSADEIDEFIDAFKRRILQAESQIHRNEILMDKVIHTLQTNLYKLEKKEYEELSKHSKDEAVRIALYLAKHPAPPMPEFPLSKEYDDPEKLADIIDDVFGRAVDDKNENDEIDAKEAEETPSITDAEAVKICSEWKTKYNVVIGVSWGDLPYDLQQKWLHYSCDYHMKEEGTS